MIDEKGDKKKTADRRPVRFVSNNRYFTISIYTIVVVVVCAVIIRSLFMWNSTWTGVVKLIQWGFPFLFGIFLACLLFPLVRFFDTHLFSSMQRKNLARGLSILLTYVVFLGIIVLAIVVIIPRLVDSVINVAMMIPTWSNNLVDFIENLNKQIPDLDLSAVTDAIQNFGNSFLGNSSQEYEEIFSRLISTGVSIVSLIVNLIIALIVSLYLLIDLERLRKATKNIIRAFTTETVLKRICKVSSECYEIFANFVSGKIVDSLIIGIICFIMMQILQLPYALVISVVVGITNMIPYFGPFIGAIPGTLLLLMVSPWKALIFVILILALQQFDGLFLGPRILGLSTGLRPVWIIFGVSAGGAVAGVIGMFIGVPIVAIVGHMLNLAIQYHKERRELRKKQEEEASMSGQEQQEQGE